MNLRMDASLRDRDWRPAMEEKFSALEVTTLRKDLLDCGLDCFQVADAIKTFIACHGYGISAEGARNVAVQLKSLQCGTDCFHKSLESAALMM